MLIGSRQFLSRGSISWTAVPQGRRRVVIALGLCVLSVAIWLHWFRIPLAAYVISFWLVLFMASWLAWNARLGALSLMLIVAYVVPFLELTGHIGVDYAAPIPDTVWGLASVPTMWEPDAVKLTAGIGAIGMCGFLIGALLAGGTIKSYRRQACSEARAFSPGVFAVGTLVLIVLIVLTAPRETILTANYLDIVPSQLSEAIPSSWLIIGIGVIALGTDAARETKRGTKAIKMTVTISLACGYILGAGLLHGSREPLLIVPALLLLYRSALPGINDTKRQRGTLLLLVACLLALVPVAHTISTVRLAVPPANQSTSGTLVTQQELASATDSEGSTWEGEVSAPSSAAVNVSEHLSNLLHGTWSAVLLTPLSAASDHVGGSEYQTGSDYVSLFASTPPQFVFDLLGWERPVSSTRGLAWDLDHTYGGLHISVMPFRNFGLMGVMAEGFVIGLFASLLWIRSLQTRSFSSLFLVTVACFALPVSFWYGPKLAWNALIVGFGVVFLVQLANSSLFQPTRTRSRD